MAHPPVDPLAHLPARNRARSLFPLLGILAVPLAVAEPVSGRQVELAVAVEENFRAQPNGAVLGQLVPETRVRPLAREGQWTEVMVEGWVWAPSLQRRQGTLNLVVVAAGGENLRSAPQGRVLGRLAQGALLEELEQGTGWIRVRRTGWIWHPSLRTLAAPAAPSPTVVPTRPGPAAPGGVGVGGAAGAADSPAQDPWIRTGPQGTAVLTGPGGDTLAVTGADTELEVLAREGNWSRVRLEGWVRVQSPETAPADTGGPGAPPLSAAELIADPERFRGRIVTVELQFISLERAERVRTDFYEGEPFLLTRSATGTGEFVYVALPPERLSEVEGVSPLERITVTGRVRAGTPTGAPLLDLLQLRRVGGSSR